MKLTNTLTRITAGASCVLMFGLPAWSAPTGDYFGRRTPQIPVKMAPITKAPVQATKPADQTGWFEQLDNAVCKYSPSATDKVILSRPINQEVERLQQWIHTASKTAHNYRKLSAIIKSIPVPEGAARQSIKEYRDLLSDWYTDTAGIYDDLVRPRPPAKTIEELQESVNQIKSRSQSLGQSKVSLRNMDDTIRQTYNIHPPRYDDALAQYVAGK